jgi:hypothetical protein
MMACPENGYADGGPLLALIESVSDAPWILLGSLLQHPADLAHIACDNTFYVSWKGYEREPGETEEHFKAEASRLALQARVETRAHGISLLEQALELVRAWDPKDEPPRFGRAS